MDQEALQGHHGSRELEEVTHRSYMESSKSGDLNGVTKSKVATWSYEGSGELMRAL